MKPIQKSNILLILIPILFLSACAKNSINMDKTLVSWVSIKNMDVKGGGVLTIQNGELFDGIILSEKGDSWIAGSEDDRTTTATNNTSVVAPGIGIVEQIAIVYKGKEILIYRDAMLQTRYKAENIDLLNSNTNMVVFGLSHYGGKGAVSGAIEDARIYSKALSEKELKLLQPNIPSTINPYAWWDFEGEELIERTGRFSFHNKYAGVKRTEGKLILNQWGYVIASKEYVPETPKWPENPPEDWVTFHLAHPGQKLAGYEPGDPNPAYFYKGRYHLHYIVRNEYGFAYAHVSSKDMVHWKWHPTVLIPPITGHGMFSGTGFFAKEGQPAMIYHGLGTDKNWVTIALDDNLDSWANPEPVIARDSEGNLIDDLEYWDPDCWLIGDTYYALSGGKDPELMKSNDLKNWDYLGKLLHVDYPDNLGVGRNEDISCANMFKIGNKWMLLCISHDLGCRYFLGDFKDGKYLPDFHASMNWGGGYSDIKKGKHGFLYFAPESMLSEDGRRVMWAWVIPDVSPVAVQSLPRELELPDDGILQIKPLKELEKLRYDEQTLKNITINSDEVFRLSDVTGDAIEMEVTFKAPLPQDFGINLLGDEKGEGGISITAGANRNTLGIGSINPPFKLKDGENLTLRIFIDKNLVEVFANDRQAAAFANEEIREKPGISFFTNDRSLVIQEVNIWKMRSVYGSTSN